MNFEIELYETVESFFIYNKKADLTFSYKTRFIFLNKKTIFSVGHFCDELAKRNLKSFSIIRNPKYNEIPSSVFEFDKICFFQTKYSHKNTLWKIERTFHKGMWYYTCREMRGFPFMKCHIVNDYRLDYIDNFISSVKAAIDFSKRKGYTKFIDSLERSLEIMNYSKNPKDVLSSILEACIFSGMGSWNDELAAICEDDISNYNEVTNSLYSAILDIISYNCSFFISEKN